MQLYQWLSSVADDRGSAKALVYRDTYLSWRGLLHRVDRRAQELHEMGIGPGAWVGLMLGNVPDFVILTLAVSKVEAVVVPLDPTTGNRELEMILEAAPLRALVTRPRGGEGVQAAAGLPYYAAPPVARPPAGPPSKFAPEIRRRLQGTLLSCSLYKRAPLANLVDEGRDAPAVVQFTASVGGDPKGVLKTAANLGAAAQAIGKTLGVTHDDRVLCTMPLHTSYGFDFGLLVALANGTTLFLEDEVSPKRIAKLLREQTIDVFAGNPALYGSLVRVPTIKPLKTSRRALPERGLDAAREHRRELPRALRHPPAVLLPRHAGGSAGDRSRGQGSRDRRARVRRRRGARRRRQGRPAAGGRDRPDLGALEDAVDAGGAEDPPAQARRRRPDRRRRHRTAGSAPATSGSSTRTGA